MIKRKTIITIQLLIFLYLPFINAEPVNPLASFSVNAMAPLKIDDNEKSWNEFRKQLTIAKNAGVNAISVDIWWGLVESKGNNQFDWQYYDKIFHEIVDAKLHIVPIMSTHRCGGYENDSCNYPIPNWIWSHFSDQGLSKSDLMYKGENGTESDEFVSLWQDEFIIPYYVQFMQAFKQQYSHYANVIDEINISLGPSGELRYPSYDPTDKDCAFPTRGCLQAYSKPAILNFQQFIINKYGSIKKINKAWLNQDELKTFKQISPPKSLKLSSKAAETFIATNQHFSSQYGRDFIDWYHQSLMNHGERMVIASHKVFKGEFSSIPLGIKIAGVHWQMSKNSPTPRAAEISAGVISSSSDVNIRDSGFGYGSLMKMIQKLNQTRMVFLHFTNLEGDDSDILGEFTAYSLAKTMVNQVATAALDNDVPLKGENAMGYGVESDHGWDNIDATFKRNKIQGITILRLENITRNTIGYKRIKQFIKHQSVKN